VIRQIKRDLANGSPRTLLAAFLYFDTSFMLWVLLGALGNHIADDLGLSTTEKGLLTAIPILSGAFLRLGLGALGDRIGGRRAGLIGMSLTMIPLIVGWRFAHDLPSLYAVGLLLGVAGASFAVALPLASRWYPREHQGLIMGIAGAGNSGTVLAFLAAPRLAETLGWNAVLGLAILPLTLVFAAFFLLAQDSPDRPPPLTVRDYAATLRQRDSLWFCVFYSVTFGGFVGLGSYLAILLRDTYGLARVEAADIAALGVFLGSFARPIGGLLADRLGGIRLLLCVFALVATLMLALAQLPPLLVGAGLLLGCMLTLGLGNGAVFQLLPQRFGARIGSMTGLVGASGGLGGFCFPLVLSALTGAAGSPAAGFLVFGLVAGFALVLLAGLQRGWQASWLGAGGIAIREPYGRAQRVTVSVEE